MEAAKRRQKLRMFAILIFGLQSMMLQGANIQEIPTLRKLSAIQTIITINNLIDSNEPLDQQYFDGLLNNLVTAADTMIYNKDEKLFADVINNDIHLHDGKLVIKKSELLCKAAEKNNVQMVQLLLAMGADVNAEYIKHAEYSKYIVFGGSGTKNMTALMHACTKDRIEAVQLLLATGADVNIKGRRIDHSVQALDFSKVYDSWNALSVACKYCENPVIIQLLLDAGADKNIIDSRGNTPLHKSINNGKIQKLLIDAGADLNSQNREGYTALYKAIFFNKQESIKLLMDGGADVNVRNGYDGETALHYVCLMGNIEGVRLLLAADANLDIQNDNGRTALHIACARNNVEITQLLCDHSANIDILDNAGNTAEQLATTPEMRNLWVQIKADKARRKRQRDEDFLDLGRSIKKDWL